MLKYCLDGAPIQRIAVVLLTLVSVTLSLCAAGIGQWYRINHETVLVQSIGLFRQCAAVGFGASEGCTSIDFSDISSGCGRDGSLMLQRVRALSVTSLIGPLLMLLSLCLGARNHCASWAAWLSCLLASMAVLLLAFNVAWGAYIFNGWYYCSSSYCTWMRSLGSSEACSSYMGTSWYLMIGGVASGTIALILVVLRLVYRLRAQASKSQLDAQRQQSLKGPERSSSASNMWATSVDNVPPTSTSRPNTNAPDEAHQGRPPLPTRWPDFSAMELNDDNLLPDGEWVLDADCGLYWSNPEQLYVHLASGMFYDPHSEMWFDAQTNEWTTGS